MTKKTLILLPLFLLALSLTPALLPTAAADAQNCCCGDNCECPADACKCVDTCNCADQACVCPADACKATDSCNCTAASCEALCKDACTTACDDACKTVGGKCADTAVASVGTKACCPAGSACPIKDAA
ncbi:MAG: hypothetical protein GX130_04790 [Candidatus Hydrogenedens sp.]|nr:hypothetical protein [Candidatus Hydrogenedens sp.]